MPHPRAKARTQMPLPWDVLDKQMARGGWARLDLTHALHWPKMKFLSNYVKQKCCRERKPERT